MIYFKNVDFKTQYFSPLIKKVLAGVNSTFWKKTFNKLFWQLYEDELEDGMLWLSISVLVTAIFGVAGVAMAAGKEILIKEWQLFCYSIWSSF